MKNFKIILQLAGLIIIGACAWMLYERFSDKTMFWTDVVVLVIIYSLNIWGVKELFLPAERFGRAIGSYGTLMVTQVTYTLLALVGIVAGYFLGIEAGWQIIYQAAFLVIMGFGIYVTLVTTRRQAVVEEKSNKSKLPVAALREQAAWISHKARLASISDEMKKEFAQIEERVNMISPNSSDMASRLEKEIVEHIDKMLVLLNESDINAYIIEQHIENCKISISQRMKLVTTN